MLKIFRRGSPADPDKAEAPAPLDEPEPHITTPPPLQTWAAPAIQPLPDYVAHRDGVPRAGALSAEAMVRDYEAAAHEIELMGAELLSAAEKCEAMTAEVHDAIAYMHETAVSYREQSKYLVRRIEECALFTKEVLDTCETIKRRIEGNHAAQEEQGASVS